MSPSKLFVLASLIVVSSVQAQSQPAPATTGTLVVIPASGEVKRANDLAVVSFMVEEHDKDKAAAAARVNQKMKQGTEIVRREDPGAELKTLGYFTYPVYPEPPPRPLNTSQPAPRVATGWRVGQYLEVKTSNLANLPKLVAAAQKVVALNNLQFGLRPETLKQLDDQRIAAGWRNLNERIVSVATAMGRRPSDAVIDVVDFEGSGRYAGNGEAAAMQMVEVTGRRSRSEEIPEPSFEPGETTLQMRLVGKVKFK